MSAEEEWRDIPGYEGLYQVSDVGRVKSFHGRHGKPVRLLNVFLNTAGRPAVRLARDKTARCWRVHRLVALAFIGPPPFDRAEVCHFDGDKTNNAVANLRWGTRSENELDKVRQGVHPNAKKTHCKRGHLFDAANTYIARKPRADGSIQTWRMCRRCGADNQAMRKARKSLVSQ